MASHPRYDLPLMQQARPPCYTAEEADRPPPYTEVVSRWRETNIAEEADPLFSAVSDQPSSYYELRHNMGIIEKFSKNPLSIYFFDNCARSSLWIAMIFILFGALPLSLLIVGAVHIDDCNIDARIPKWMVVYGSVSVTFSLLHILKSIFCQKKERRNGEGLKRSLINKCTTAIEGILCLILSALVILGSFFVPEGHEEWANAGELSCDDASSHDHNKCCHKGTLLFALTFLITMQGLIFGFLFIGSFCICSCIMMACGYRCQIYINGQPIES